MDVTRREPEASPQGLGKGGILARSAFGDLPPRSRDTLLSLAELARLPRRTVVTTEGEPAASLLVIGVGRVKIERRRGDDLVALGHRGPGHLVGETAVAGAAATESASVVDDVEALSIPLVPLRQTLAADPPLRGALAAAIVRQHRELSQRLSALLLHGVEARVAGLLLDVCARWGAPHPEGELCTAPFTHAEMAELIGSTRETVTLVLGRLRREGLIGFERRRVFIRDRARLAARASAPAA